MGERGIAAYKSEASMRGSLQSEEFPSLCEKCLGENPYIRMQKRPGGSSCKICDIPFTVFSWRPGRGSLEKKSEICSNCSKIKNLCQCCILDLKFGLPVQLRDAVLASEGDITQSATSDVNRNFQYSQQVALMNSGHDPWSNGEGPNERLLELARNISNERSQPRVHLDIKTNNNKQLGSHSNDDDDDDTLQLIPSLRSENLKSKTLNNNDNHTNDNPDDDKNYKMPLPPGINDISELSTKKNRAADDGSNPKKKKKNVPPPRPPPGPPPPEAFIKK